MITPAHGDHFFRDPPQEKNMKRLSCLMLLSLLSMAVLAGCNTVAGAGKDVQKAGEKVEDAATR